MTKYENGLYFSDPLGLWVDEARSFVEKKKATLILVDGSLGGGKTTLSVHLADHYSRKNILFNVQYALGGEKFADKLLLTKKEKLNVIIYDEAGDFSRRGALTKFNRDLNRIFQTYRSSRIAVIMVLPSIGIVDKDLFTNGIVRFGINCHDREDHYGNFRVYDRTNLMWLRKKITEYVTPWDAYRHVSPNFRGHFKPLPPKRQKVLDDISQKGKDDILYNASGYVDKKELMKIFSRSHVWVSEHIKKLKIVHKMKRGNKHMYSKEAVEKIKKYIEDRGL